MFEGARKQRLKLTFVILGVSVIVLVITFAYGAWARAEGEKELVPRLGMDEMVKALREFQRKTGQFPDDFMELEERGIWKHKTIPDFGPSKRTRTHLNYYYVYGKSSASVCTVWAIPSGPKREEASTHFLVVRPDVIQRWKGPALTKTDIDRIDSNPSEELLNMLGLTAQPTIDQRKEKRSAGLF
jgi:hypothetical protein